MNKYRIKFLSADDKVGTEVLTERNRRIALQKVKDLHGDVVVIKTVVEECPSIDTVVDAMQTHGIDVELIEYVKALHSIVSDVSVGKSRIRTKKDA